MALDDIGGTNRYCWYDAAWGNMSDYSIATSVSVDFGKGKENTEKMIKYWNEKKYGAQDDNGTYKDMWGAIQEEVAKGWFVPSRAEWAAFAEELGITSSNYSSKGLSDWYWSSSQCTTYNSWNAYLSVDYMYHYDVYIGSCVRLSATF